MNNDELVPGDKLLLEYTIAEKEQGSDGSWWYRLLGEGQWRREIEIRRRLAPASGLIQTIENIKYAFNQVTDRMLSFHNRSQKMERYALLYATSHTPAAIREVDEALKKESPEVWLDVQELRECLAPPPVFPEEKAG